MKKNEVMLLTGINTEIIKTDRMIYTFAQVPSPCIGSPTEPNSMNYKAWDVKIEEFYLENHHFYFAIHPEVEEKFPFIKLFKIINEENEYYKTRIRYLNEVKEKLEKYEDSKIIKFLEFLKILK